MPRTLSLEFFRVVNRDWTPIEKLGAMIGKLSVNRAYYFIELCDFIDKNQK